MLEDIRLDEWLSELERLSANIADDDALTTRELVSSLGRTTKEIDNLLRAGIEEGRIECIVVSRKNRTGHISRVPGYRLAPGERKARKVPKKGGDSSA